MSGQPIPLSEIKDARSRDRPRVNPMAPRTKRPFEMPGTKRGTENHRANRGSSKKPFSKQSVDRTKLRKERVEPRVERPAKPRVERSTNPQRSAERPRRSARTIAIACCIFAIFFGATIGIAVALPVAFFASQPEALNAPPPTTSRGVPTSTQPQVLTNGPCGTKCFCTKTEYKQTDPGDPSNWALSCRSANSQCQTPSNPYQCQPSCCKEEDSTENIAYCITVNYDSGNTPWKLQSVENGAPPYTDASLKSAWQKYPSSEIGRPEFTKGFCKTSAESLSCFNYIYIDKKGMSDYFCAARDTDSGNGFAGGQDKVYPQYICPLKWSECEAIS